MPSPVFNVTLLSQAIQYTGSNSADIDSQVPNVSIISEISGVLLLDFNGNTLTVYTNDWVIFDVNGTNVLPDSLFVNEKDCVPICSELQAVADDLSAATSYGAVRAMGIAAVPTLLLGQDTTVNVQLQPAMPDSGYSAYATVFGGVNLADLDVTSVSVVDTDTVSVAVDNSGVGTISGVTLVVHAVD